MILDSRLLSDHISRNPHGDSFIMFDEMAHVNEEFAEGVWFLIEPGSHAMNNGNFWDFCSCNKFSLSMFLCFYESVHVMISFKDCSASKGHY